MDIITFGTGTLYATPINDFSGAPLANATPVRFGQLQDVGVDFSFEEKMLYGSGQFPIGIGRGNGKISGNAKLATISMDAFATLFIGQAATPGIRTTNEDVAAVIPASTPWQITATPPSTGTFALDLGVVNATTGQRLVKTASGPTTGQYSVTSGGVYTFAAADTGIPITYSYEYTATSTLATYLPLTNKRMGLMPFFQMTLVTTYSGAALSLHLNKVASNKFSIPHKNDDFSVSDFDFNAFADPAGNIGYFSTSQ